MTIVRINAVYDDGSIAQLYPATGDGKPGNVPAGVDNTPTTPNPTPTPTPTPLPVPSPPTLLNATAQTTTSVALKWSDNSAIETGFRVERRPSGGSWSVLTASLPQHTQACMDSTAVSGTTYDYRVFAFNDTGDSAPTNTATVTLPTVDPIVTPPSPTAPALPTSFVAVPASPTSVVLTWNDVATDEVGYRIERQNTQGWAVLTTLAPNSTTYTDSTVSQKTTYTYRICAVGQSVDSAYVTSATITTPAVSGGSSLIPWGFVASDKDNLNALDAAMNRAKADGASWVRIWHSNWSTISTGNQAIIKLAKKYGLKVFLTHNVKDDTTAVINFGTPDIPGFIAKNKTMLQQVDIYGAGNELNLNQYRPNDFGSASNYHTNYVNQWLKPMHDGLNPIGVKVACTSITDTYNPATYATQYDALHAAGAASYCEYVDVHLYAVPSYVSLISSSIIPHIRSTWAGKLIFVSEGNVQYKNLTTSAWQSQIAPYVSQLRLADVEGFTYYRGLQNSLSAGAYLFDASGVARNDFYPYVRDALTT